MYFFKPSELANFAMAIEKNGLEFYRVLTEKTKEKEAKELFSFMAKEEEGHYYFFEKLSSKLASYEMPEVEDEEYKDYMRQLVDSHVFTTNINAAELAQKADNPITAIDLALNFEKDTIIFFSHLKKIMPLGEQTSLDEIIKEENRHIKKLLTFKKLMTSTREDFYTSQKTWDSQRQ